jgi:cation transport ATPase
MPIVAGLFYPFNVTISPIWSSIAMSASSIIVVGFSHLLSLFTYDENETEKKQIKKGK